MPSVEVLLEAEKRGLLDADNAALLNEARKRGFAPAPPIPEPDTSGVTRAGGEPLTGTQGLGPDLARRADDTARSMAAGATFNFADEIAAGAETALGEGDFEENVAAERARDEEIPLRAAIPGQVTGALLTGTGLAKAGVSLLPGATRTLPSLAGRGAAEGALFGAAFGAGAGEDAGERLRGAATGAATGAALGGTLGAFTRVMAGGVTRPTVEGLKAQSKQAFDAADAAGVVVKADSVKRIAKDLQTRLADEGLDKGLHPSVVAAFKRIESAADENQTFKGLEILRRISRDAKASNNASERRMASILVEEFDDAVSALGSRDVVVGNAAEAVKKVKEARKLWSIARKTEAIEELIERAGVRAGQFSGSGFENAMRTEFRQLALNPKKMRTFTKAEQGFIKQVAKGKPLANAMRFLGKFAPRGVISAMLGGGVGGAVGGPAGAAGVIATGEAGRSAATALTKGSAREVVNEILGTVTKGPVTITSKQADLLRNMLLTSIQAESQVN